ncbi:transposase [Streptomyces sp. L-9-10]|nr:transposase [Streptomyces sp. L-9-10]
MREAANQRLWDTLYRMLSVGQRAVPDSLLTVPPGERVSELDRLRRGPVRVSGPQMKRALERAEEIAALGMGALDVSGIPPRRLAELSRYGVDGKASLLRRHSDARRPATLLATTVYLTSRAVDDALDLLEVLIATKLPAKAERESFEGEAEAPAPGGAGVGEAGDRLPGRVAEPEVLRAPGRQARHRRRMTGAGPGKAALGLPRPGSFDQHGRHGEPVSVKGRGEGDGGSVCPGGPAA